MNKVLAFAWLVTIGSNGASKLLPGHPLRRRCHSGGRDLFRIRFSARTPTSGVLQRLPACSFPSRPADLAHVAFDESFERHVYTSLSSVALVFVVASVLALRSDLDRITEWAAFSIVATGVTLNLYELFVANNLWSNAPGRSAGFYVDANISALALPGYGLLFLTARAGNLRLVDPDLDDFDCYRRFRHVQPHRDTGNFNTPHRSSLVAGRA